MGKDWARDFVLYKLHAFKGNTTAKVFFIDIMEVLVVGSGPSASPQVILRVHREGNILNNITVVGAKPSLSRGSHVEIHVGWEDVG